MVFADLTNEEDEIAWLAETIDLYTEMRTQYLDAMLLFNAWARAQRLAGGTGKIDLDEFEVSKHLSVDCGPGTVKANYDLCVLNSLAPDRRPIIQAEIEQQAVWFGSRDLGRHFRGKQEIEFLYIFLTFVIENVNAGRKSYLRKNRITKRVSRKDIIFDLSNFAETSTSLVGFLLARKSSWLPSLPTSAEPALKETSNSIPS